MSNELQSCVNADFLLEKNKKITHAKFILIYLFLIWNQNYIWVSIFLLLIVLKQTNTQLVVLANLWLLQRVLCTLYSSSSRAWLAWRLECRRHSLLYG